MSRWTYAVIADSHFHPPGVPDQAAFASDASFNARNAAAVALLQRVAPDFVVHLGDVPHPVPGLATHRQALGVAVQTYQQLPCPLHMVPGNHDVGDKRHPWAPAPSVSLDKHAVYSEHWGPPWWHFERHGHSFLGIDTPVLGSGLELEEQQWAWLERTLAAARGPVSAFLHYPPFLLHPDEDEHYDNLAPGVRARLLALFAQHGVRSAFCGHVHHPFWHHHDGTDWVLLPSTAFVRPGYAELARVAPGDAEAGRNEAGRLGLCLVHVDGEQTELEWVWTHGRTALPAWAPGLAPGEQPAATPLGISLRHAWDAVLDVPTDNLDPFRRKRARNDRDLLAAWTAGVRRLRLPLQDLRRAPTRVRLQHLAAQGFRFVLFSAEALSPADRALLTEHAGMVDAVELILPRDWLDRVLPALPVPVWVAAYGRHPAADETYFSHFAPHGFTLDEPDLQSAPGDRVLVRIPGVVDAWRGVVQARQLLGERAACLVELPRQAEGAAFTDDLAVARRVAAAAVAAAAFPDTPVLLDGFADHDRGYFPRHGLVDRRGDPRPAWHVLHHLARLLPRGVAVEEGLKLPGLGTLCLQGGTGLDLVSGCEGTSEGPVLVR